MSHGTCVEARRQLEKSVFSVYWVGPGDDKSTGLAAPLPAEPSQCPKCVYFHISFLEEIVLRASDGPQLPPRVLAQEVICLDSSSGSEDEKSSRDGKIRPDGHLVHFLLANVHLYFFFFLVCVGM